MAITAGILLAAYLSAILYVMLSPVKQRDPAMGAAEGCLVGLILGVLTLAGLLAIGVIWYVRWLVILIFAVTVSPFAWMVLGTPVYLMKLRARRRERIQYEQRLAAPDKPAPER